MITAAVVLLALQFSTNRAFQKRCGTAATASLTFTAIGSVCSALVGVIVAYTMFDGLQFSVYSTIMAAILSVLCVAYTYIGFKIMAYGSMSLFTMFLMLGGMMLPFIYGVVFLNETLTPCRLIGLILLVVSMVFPVAAKEKQNKSENRSKKDLAVFVVLCTSVFMLNGFVSITSKIHQINTEQKIVNSPSFSFMSAIIKLVLCGALLLIYEGSRKKKGEKSCFEGVKPSFIIGVSCVGALFSSVSYILQLISASEVDAAMLYPMITGGSTVLCALAGFIFFKEKPDKLSFVGLVLSFAATFLFLF